jgi:hypothetical protein
MLFGLGATKIYLIFYAKKIYLSLFDRCAVFANRRAVLGNKCAGESGLNGATVVGTWYNQSIRHPIPDHRKRIC